MLQTRVISSAGGKKAIDMLLKGDGAEIRSKWQHWWSSIKRPGGDMADAQMKGISDAMDEVVSLKGVTGKKDSIGAMIAREAAKDTTMATALMASTMQGLHMQIPSLQKYKEMSRGGTGGQGFSECSQERV